LIAVILDQPEPRWRQSNSTGDLCNFDEYHGRIVWRLAYQGTRYCVDFDETLLLRLFQRIRGLDSFWWVEPDLWLAIVKIGARALPREIGLALAKDNYYGLPLALATSDQHADVYWEVSSRDDQSRNRFARRLILEDRFSTADIERFLDLFAQGANRYTLLSIMRGGRGASEEKLASLAAWEAAQS